MNEGFEGVRHLGSVKVASCLGDSFGEIFSPFIHLFPLRCHVSIVSGLKYL